MLLHWHIDQHGKLVQEVRMTPENNTNDTVSRNIGGATGDVKTSNTNDNKKYGRCEHFRKPATTGRPVLKQLKFLGKCEDLTGHIYDCADARQSDIFVKTTKAIAKYVGVTPSRREVTQDELARTYHFPHYSYQPTQSTRVGQWFKSRKRSGQIHQTHNIPG
jgi:hypothetical protein